METSIAVGPASVAGSFPGSPGVGHVVDGSLTAAAVARPQLSKERENSGPEVEDKS